MLPINPTLAPGELEEELRRIRVDALIVPGWEPVPSWAAASNPAFGLFQVSKAATSLDEVALTQLRPIARRPLRAGSVNAQSVCAIFRTSGTTGAAQARAGDAREPDRDGAQDGALAWAQPDRPLGLHHADLLQCEFQGDAVVPLLIGCSVAMPQTSTGRRISIGGWPSCRPTWLTAAPAFLQALLEKLRVLPPEASHAHALRFVLSTASYLPETFSQSSCSSSHRRVGASNSTACARPA